MTPDEIRKEIASLPDDDPTTCEGQIRRLHEDIQAVEDANEKQKLLHELQAVACRGLSKELKDMMEKKGLGLEGLVLVLKNLTNEPELAKYLYSNEGTDEEASLGVIRKQIGPEITKVIGGHKSEEIDVPKEWENIIFKMAPSLRHLELSTSPKVLDVITQLARLAETELQHLLPVPHDPELAKENTERKLVDVEKLKKAKELMNEAKALTMINKKELKDKLDATAHAMEIPPDWYKNVSPEKLMQDLNKIIQSYSNVLESSESYTSYQEVVVKASGGRALCGIYHSEYEPPKPTGQPVLSVLDVKISNPSQGIVKDCMRFAKQGVAKEYVDIVKSSSTSVGVAVGGFYGLVGGEVRGAYGSEHKETDCRTNKSLTTSVSVLQYIRIAMKSFQFEREKMTLPMAAREYALNIAKTKNSSEAARSFMQRYGSHVPAGEHTLGGVFFSIADAESQTKMVTSEFATEAVNTLQAGISASGLGIEPGVKVEHNRSSGKAEGSKIDENSTSYTYSIQTIGPSASNPETFQKLLSYNSTWAIIDRGPPEGYIPVWELIRGLGSQFNSAADILEQTWKEDEEKKKETCEHRYKKEGEQWKDEEEEKRKEVKMKETREELETTKGEHLERLSPANDGYWPINGKCIFTQDWMTHEHAYDKAINLIMKGPEYNICEIKSNRNLLRMRFRRRYSLKCWTALDDTPITFDSGSGDHVLFFSEVCFKWKDQIPRRG